MTHRERFEKAKAAVQASIPQDEECVVMLIVMTPDEGFSVMSNLSNEGKIRLLKDVLHGYEHDRMDCESPKSIQ
jgi:hypothetical protein